MKSSSCLFLLLLLLAASPKPATTQSTDGAAPRAALLMYDKLVGPHDADKAIGLYHTTATRERALAEVLAKVDGELAHLLHAATKKYGKEIGLAMVSSVGCKTADDINKAKITVKGDIADVLFPGDDEPTQMRRVDGEWKIDTKAVIQRLNTDLRRYRQTITTLATEIHAIADQIDQGRFPTPEKPSALLLEAQKKSFNPNDE